MIYISKPYIEERGNEMFLVSIVKDESRNLQTELWYSVEKQYGQYLCDDYADSFLLVVLAVAMHSKQDIKIDDLFLQGFFSMFIILFNLYGKRCFLKVRL